jgi:hypothetical protein
MNDLYNDDDDDNDEEQQEEEEDDVSYIHIEVETTNRVKGDRVRQLQNNWRNETADGMWLWV